MKIESVVIVVNSLMEKQQYGASRSIMLKEWNRLTDPLTYQKLNGEAKELMKVIAIEMEKDEFCRLSEKDKRILNLLNESVQDVKLPYAKKIFKEHRDLISQSYAQKWLSSDARFMCFAWGQNE